MDVKMYQNKEFEDIFSNDEDVPQKMNVGPVEFKIKPNFEIPDQHITASLPPVHLQLTIL